MPETDGNAETPFKMPNLSEIGGMTDEELAAYAPVRSEKARLAHDNRNDYCERCGGAQGTLVYGDPRMCGCPKRVRAAERALAEIDPSGEMAFSQMEDPHPTVADAAGKLRAIVAGERAHGLMMFGLPGRGKTFLSVAAARALLAAGSLVGVYSLAGLVGRVQNTYGHDDARESGAKIVAEVCSCDVVVLDDVGKEHRSANVESIVYELVDGMHRAGAVLIASSNLPARSEPPGGGFVERYDGAVLSRLGGMCEKVVIRGGDRRAEMWEW